MTNIEGDGYEDVAGSAYAYYENSGDFMFFGGTPGSGNFNDEQDLADGSLELMVENYLGITDPTVFSLTKANDITSTRYDAAGNVTASATASGTWATANPVELLSFYVVKAANNYAMYYVNPAESTGSWSTYDLWNAGYGGNEPLEISHFNGYNTSTVPVPEPATMLLLGAGLIGLAGARFRKKK
ncbi:PEP-CTERM sorting domain-containing protein [Desulfocastanea catecholica]